jgi:hypothetical protein
VRCETLGTAGSFRMVAPPAPVWVTHADADRSRPFHAGYEDEPHVMTDA